MAHNHKSHFIPSPFKVVTQYENAFIKVWNSLHDKVIEGQAEDLVFEENGLMI